MTIKTRNRKEGGCAGGRVGQRGRSAGTAGAELGTAGGARAEGEPREAAGPGSASLPPSLAPSLRARRAPLPPRRRLFPLWLPPMAQKAAAEAGPPSPFHPHAESAGVAPATRGHVTSTCSAGRRPPSAAICFPQSAPARSRHLRGRGTATPPHTHTGFQQITAKPLPKTRATAKHQTAAQQNKQKKTPLCAFLQVVKWKVKIAAR